MRTCSETRRKLLGLLVIILLSGSQMALATSDPLSSLLVTPGGAGMGFATGMENSPYRHAGTRNDLVPLYLYEGEHFYLHGYRGGLKLLDSGENRLDVFIAHRFEGFPYDRVMPALVGMTARSPGADFGMSYQYGRSWGALYAEYLHDITGASAGNELRLGYNYEWRRERWLLRPHLMLAARDARLNDYYYGVLPGEGTASRPAYRPGSGINGQLGLYGAYSLTERWRLLAGIAATRWAEGVRASPVVDSRLQMTGALGLMYDISPVKTTGPESLPLIVKVMYGRSTDCNLASIMEFVCASTKTQDMTSLSAIEVGRTFIKGLNGWPVDVAGYAGLLHHAERGFQQDFWQADAYVKAFYYGFPWSERVKTRLGMGIGVSYAQKVPFVELQAQAIRGRNSSKLLNYLDPSIDVSVGDLFGIRTLSETYLGFGVSHRSGIFGSSQLLGNVNGGSNYIYSYLEWQM